MVHLSTADEKQGYLNYLSALDDIDEDDDHDSSSSSDGEICDIEYKQCSYNINQGDTYSQHFQINREIITEILRDYGTSDKNGNPQGTYELFTDNDTVDGHNLRRGIS